MTYQAIDKVSVSLDFGSHQFEVGVLARKLRDIVFQYHPKFVENGFELSPFHLPLQSGLFECKESAFEGLFGLFNDSLPDGWGKLLLDRQLLRTGIEPGLLSPLDRLTHIGPHGMGALVYQPCQASYHDDGLIDLECLAKESQQVLSGTTDVVFEELLVLNGSSHGARPKVMVGVDSSFKHLIYGVDGIPDDFQYWLIKFRSLTDPIDAGAIEYAYSKMAKAAGVDVMPCHLFPEPRGRGFFGVQRFDRGGSQRFHVQSACALLHADHRLPSLDYQDLLKATLLLTKDIHEVEKMFRIAVFNLFAHNRDDHSKNFSFLMNHDGQWKVAPAYDLTFSFGPSGEHCTTVMKEGRSPTVSHLYDLANVCGLSKGQSIQITDEVRQAVQCWKAFAGDAGVSQSMIKRIGKFLSR